MSRNVGSRLTELRRSGAAGTHGKKSADRYNTEREAIAEAMDSQPWWCGYPGCLVTGECGRGPGPCNDK